MSWALRAACRDSPFADKAFGTSAEQYWFIRRYCRTCDVAAECLASAGDEPGVYGGTTEGQRSRSIDHGENRGYWQHRRLGIPACQPCKDAHNDYTYRAKVRRAERMSA